MVPAGAFALALFALLYRVITVTGWRTVAAAAPQPTTARLGTHLLTDYIFPFEFVSLLLLMAMVGSAILVRERRGRDTAPAADSVPEPGAGEASLATSVDAEPKEQS